MRFFDFISRCSISLRMTVMIGVFLCVQTTFARPVSYPDGWTVMQMNDADRSSLHVHYSPTKDYSIGYIGQYWTDENFQFHGAQLNYLLKRWNKPASQANIYLKGGAGLAQSDHQAFDNEVEAAGFASLAMDWENRRWFTAYENHLLYAGDIEKHFTQKARIGIAPYIGDYGDLHTWLMLQVEHQPEEEDQFVITPLVRLFKGEYLAEMGINDEGKALFNWIVRF